MAAHHKTLTRAECVVRSARCVVRCVACLVLTVLALTIMRADPQAAKPARIVSLVPAVTEMLFAVGAGNDVVGVSSFDNYPPEAKARPRVGALIDPDFERILSLRPDLVVAYGSQTELIARLDRARVPIFRYEHAGLADITLTIRQLGIRIERAKEADALASRIEGDLDAIRKSVAGKPRPRTILLFDREPGSLRGIYASGGVGFMHDMLVLAGGQDVFEDVKRQSLQATAEILLARAPEVIVEVQAWADWPPERVARERAAWNGLPSIPAVKNGRVHFVRDDRLVVPGPRVAEAVRLLADTIHANTRSSFLGISPFSNDSVKNRSSAALPRVP